jgi:hypothetical protein
MNTLYNIFFVFVIFIIIYLRYAKKEQFIEQTFPDSGLVFLYAHIYAMRNSGNLDDARAKIDRLFIKLKYPIDEIRKANADYTKYEKYFKEVIGSSL